MPQQPAAKFRKGGTGQAQRGGPHHAPRTPGLCFLCNKSGHLARDCAERGSGGSSTQAKRAFGSGAYAYGCWDNEYAVYDDYDEYPEEYCPEFCGDQEDVSCTGAGMTWSSGYKYGILDGGATSSCGSFELIQLIADAWEPLERYPALEDNGGKNILFAGGEGSSSKVLAWMPNELFEDGIAINVVPCTSTPILIGLDVLRYYGLVLDYAHNTVYSHRLKRSVPCTAQIWTPGFVNDARGGEILTVTEGPCRLRGSNPAQCVSRGQ